MKTEPGREGRNRNRRPETGRKSFFSPRVVMPSTSLSGFRQTGHRQSSRKPLVLVECEGCIFDTYGPQVRLAYVPAFLPRFACAAPEPACSELWMDVALRSRYRGTEPLRMLAVVLRLLNRIHAPSVRRSIVASTLESRLSVIPAGMWRYDLDFRMDPVLKPALDWMKESESLISSMPLVPVFACAKETLEKLCNYSTVACISRNPEAETGLLWNKSGLSTTGVLVSGKEHGDLGTCLRRAIQSGFDVHDITVIGSTLAALSAALASDARFYPILPGCESNSWTAICEPGNIDTVNPLYSMQFLEKKSGFSDFIEIIGRKAGSLVHQDRAPVESRSTHQSHASQSRSGLHS